MTLLSRHHANHFTYHFYQLHIKIHRLKFTDLDQIWIRRASRIQCFSLIPLIPSQTTNIVCKIFHHFSNKINYPSSSEIVTWRFHARLEKGVGRGHENQNRLMLQEHKTKSKKLTHRTCNYNSGDEIPYLLLGQTLIEVSEGGTH